MQALITSVVHITRIDRAIFHTGNGNKNPATSRNLRKLLKANEGKDHVVDTGDSWQQEAARQDVRQEPGDSKWVQQAVDT